jgi:hypothetical protein
MVNHPQTGEEGYRVGMEVFHQLHCLNLLRRVTYRDYYEPLGGEIAVGADKLQAHTGEKLNQHSSRLDADSLLDHCIEVLRLNLQCTADVGVFSLYLLPGDPLAWPQLNSNHVCRNFDAVKQWALDNTVGNMEVAA